MWTSELLICGLQIYVYVDFRVPDVWTSKLLAYVFSDSLKFLDFKFTYMWTSESLMCGLQNYLPLDFKFSYMWTSDLLMCALQIYVYMDFKFTSI